MLSHPPRLLIKFCIIVAVVVLLAGCPVDAPEPGSFTIRLSTPRAAKDILFFGTDTAVVRYNLHFDGPGDEDFDVLDHAGSTYTKTDASPGDWLLGVFGENDAGTEVSSSTTISFTIADGDEKTIDAECTTYQVRGVYTLAGSGTSGATDGTGTAARFNGPKGVTVDSNGNIYVADTGNHKIRKVTSEGVVTTLAGSGSQGSANGTGSAASFDSPVGIVADASGNLYVSEWGNDAIRKISPAGVVTTFVEGGAMSPLANPSGLALDSSGNLFIADTGSSTIKKVSTLGVVSTFAGIAHSPNWFDSTDPLQARFDSPQGLSINSSDGTLYVADTGNHRVRKITSAGVVTTMVGDSAGYQPGFYDGKGTDTARLNSPKGISYFGNVYIADTGNHASRTWTAYNSSVETTGGKDPDDAVLNVPSSGLANGNYDDARFNAPEGIFTFNDFTYVADTGNHVIRKIVN
jgi:sugar lactone lactonase YvrE